MKNYDEELMRLHEYRDKVYQRCSELENEIENTEKQMIKTLISAIKDYMNENHFTKFILYFEMEDDRIDKKFEEEYSELWERVEDDIIDSLMSDEEEYTYLSIENNLLQLHWQGDYCRNEDRYFGENRIVKYVKYDKLEQIYYNLQNDDFHRMNELINNN